MTAHSSDIIRPTWRVLCGDVRDRAADLGRHVAHCCITSPPYFRQRFYLKANDPLVHQEIGREKSLALYLDAMVDAFRAVKRVLRLDGTLFVNLGDKYSGEGDVQNVPHRLAEALRADGWFWRDTIIWVKAFDGDLSRGQSMPENLTTWEWVRCRKKVGLAVRRRHPATGDDERESDCASLPLAGYVDCPGCDRCKAKNGFVLKKGRGRCSGAHEYIFVFSQRRTYFWDADAVRAAGTGLKGGACFGKQGETEEDGSNSRRYDRPHYDSHHRRDVWFCPPKNYSGIHTATYPMELIGPAIEAATPKIGVCRDCGAPYARVPSPDSVLGALADSCWWATCACDGPPVPATVFDPFAGTGTTIEAAMQLGRYAIGTEISSATIARDLVPRMNGWRARAKTLPGQMKLFMGEADE